jgi:ubiquinone/menaquinone biosynthesis C-methylase UbiE
MAVDVYQYFVNYVRAALGTVTVERSLTLGCGAGDLERGLTKYGFTKFHDACDIAPEAIQRARDQAAAEGMTHLEYFVSDINKIDLPENYYDIVFGVMSIHHLSNLEHVYAQVKKTLKPGGFFLLNEFVGPTQFQWTDRQLEVVNGLLKVLPEKYRVSVIDRKTVKRSFERPTIEWMNQVDPSESIRSKEIIPVLKKFFSISDYRNLGGTIVHLILQDIAGNFNYNNERDMKLLNFIFELEDALIDSGEIESDFMAIIARK